MSFEEESIILREIRIVVLGPEVFMNSSDTVKAVERRDGDVIPAPVCEFDDAVIIFETSELFVTHPHLGIYLKCQHALLT